MEAEIVDQDPYHTQRILKRKNKVHISIDKGYKRNLKKYLKNMIVEVICVFEELQSNTYLGKLCAASDMDTAGYVNNVISRSSDKIADKAYELLGYNKKDEKIEYGTTIEFDIDLKIKNLVEETTKEIIAILYEK